MVPVIALLDLIAVLAVGVIAWMFYKKFFSKSDTKKKVMEKAYEQGFNDAVRYFGVKVLYDEDQQLKSRMTEVLTTVSESPLTRSGEAQASEYAAVSQVVDQKLRTLS